MGEKPIEIRRGGGAEEMESKKRRILDLGVITGKKTERGKEEKVQLGKKMRGGIRGEKNPLLPCNEFVVVF